LKCDFSSFLKNLEDSPSQKVYERETNDNFEREIATVTASLTNDSWTSHGTESYVAITAHFIDPDWEFRIYTLQIC
jgi:hypothetical protein